MESIGKERDLDGRKVHQGIAVYGNKGSTDQHAYVQQLREGVHKFFLPFLKCAKAAAGESIELNRALQRRLFARISPRHTSALFDGPARFDHPEHSRSDARSTLER